MEERGSLQPVGRAFIGGFLVPMGAKASYCSDHSMPSNFHVTTWSIARTLTRTPTESFSRLPKNCVRNAADIVAPEGSRWQIPET